MGNLDHFYCAMMAVEKREMSVVDQEVHRQGCRVLVCASRKVVGEVELLNATPYDVSNVELGHHGEDVSFNPILPDHRTFSMRLLAILLAVLPIKVFWDMFSVTQTGVCLHLIELRRREKNHNIAGG